MNKLCLASDIFREKQIEDAIKAFSSICSISVSRDATGFICVFENTLYDVSKTMKEFENYVIDLVNMSKDWCDD